MRWSWTLTRIAGIKVDVHATFLILLAWVALIGYAQGRTAAAAFGGILLIITIFASVVLHELGHALTAARFGVKTRSITLLPIGGVAQLERIPNEPRQELVIAIAGPVVTVAIVGVLYLILRATGFPIVPSTMRTGTVGAFIAQVMWVNIVLAVFNLLPAFPMDGGRVLRAALAMRMPFARATAIAARIGKVFALLFALVGLFVFSNPFLVIIAVFVWLSAASESAAAQLKAAIGDATVARAMVTDVHTLTPSHSVSAAVDAVRSGFQHDFPVVDGHALAGVLTRENLLRALAEGRETSSVGEVMERSFSATAPDESLDRALERLRGCRCRTLPVLRGNEVVGLLTADKISEFVQISSISHDGVGHS